MKKAKFLYIYNYDNLSNKISKNLNSFKSWGDMKGICVQ